MADNNHDVLSVVKQLEEAGDITFDIAEKFREAVSKNRESILSLYILDVNRSGITDSKEWVRIYKELTLLKDFSMLLGAPLPNQPVRELTQDEISQHYDRKRDFLINGSEESHEQHSEGYR